MSYYHLITSFPVNRFQKIKFYLIFIMTNVYLIYKICILYKFYSIFVFIHDKIKIYYY